MSTRVRLLPLGFLALLGFGAHRDDRAEIEIVYLANEGFLVSAGDTKLLIDAFVAEPYGEYAALPVDLHADMVAARAPFDGVDLALTSHFHRDHFQASSAAEYLKAQASVPFLSAPDVIDLLAKQLGEGGVRENVRALLPEPEKTLAAEEGSIDVELLRLPHGVTDNGVQNLGHVIELGDARLLHVGDSDVRAADLVAYRLPERAIDVAFLPYWWLMDADSVQLSRERTGAKHIVAMHVPPAEVAAVKHQLAQVDPAIVVFERAGETRTLRLEK